MSILTLLSTCVSVFHLLYKQSQKPPGIFARMCHAITLQYVSSRKYLNNAKYLVRCVVRCSTRFYFSLPFSSPAMAMVNFPFEKSKLLNDEKEYTEKIHSSLYLYIARIDVTRVKIFRSLC